MSAYLRLAQRLSQGYHPAVNHLALQGGLQLLLCCPGL